MLHLIISTQSFVFLMLASFLAGFLDAIAGGGGLITIPAYQRPARSHGLCLQ